MSGAPRAVWDAIAQAKRAAATGDGGAASQHGDAPPWAVLHRYTDMQIVRAFQRSDLATILELRPVGHTLPGSRRWVCIEGVTAVYELDDHPPPTHRNRRGPTYAQHQDDLGDDINERERENRE